MEGPTLEEYIKDMDAGLKTVILTIAKVSADMRAVFAEKRGAANSKNVYGETQQKLDVWADEVLTKELLKTGEMKAVLSEEQEKATLGKGKYIVTMDPLDGSSNIKSNNMFGTIIGIYEGDEILQKGKNLKAAFYVMYGPLTTIVMATDKVAEFVYDKKFYLAKDDIKLPEKGKLYSMGGANDGWSKENKALNDEFFNQGLKLRYGGAFVGDINQILTYGGIFYYPANDKKPNGTLRLVIECNPMAYIITKAGGTASDGKQNILDIQPTEIAHRTPIYIGNKDLVAQAEKT
jgi:fructose-1,6-bisphosphatase I